MKKSLTVSELEALLRLQQTNERDVIAIEAQRKGVKKEDENVVNSLSSSASNTQASALVQQVISRLVCQLYYCHKCHSEVLIFL